MAATAHDQPSEVVAEEGEVHIDGPDGVAFSFTPEAAIETAERLFRAGVMAQGQRLDQAKRRR
jgi:hypothetical protein